MFMARGNLNNGLASMQRGLFGRLGTAVLTKILEILKFPQASDVEKALQWRVQNDPPFEGCGVTWPLPSSLEPGREVALSAWVVTELG